MCRKSIVKNLILIPILIEKFGSSIISQLFHKRLLSSHFIGCDKLVTPECIDRAATVTLRKKIHPQESFFGSLFSQCKFCCLSDRWGLQCYR